MWPRLQHAPREGLLGLVALVLSSVAIAWRLVPAEGVPPFDPWFLRAMTTLVTLALLAGLVARAAEPAHAAPRLPSSASGVRLPTWEDLALALPACMPLWLLPWAPDPLSVAGLAGLAVFLLASHARRDPLRACLDARGRGALDLFARALLGLTALVTALYLAIALHMVGGRDNDASYYFGVARWIASRGALEEPVIWHFLAPPETIVHPAFDYWQGLTSIVLAVPMAIFGRTHLVASVTMALLSGASVFAFAWLVVVARPFRSRATQLAAIVAFALSPAMQAYRFDTETLVVFHLGLLGALLALAYDRLVLATALAFLPFLTRADGVVTCALVWGLVLARASSRRPDRELFGAERARRVVAVLATMGTAVVLFIASSVARFGTPTPPAARMAPFLGSYLDLYVWDPTRRPGGVLALLASRLELVQVEAAALRVVATFEEIPYVIRPDVLLAALPLGALAVLRPRVDRDGLHRLALALVAVGSTIIAWLSPIVFSEGRTLHPLLPAMALVVFASWELVPRALAHRLRARPEAARVAFALVSGLALVPVLAWSRPYRPLAVLRADFEADLADLDQVMHGEPVATTSPWWVIANTESPAVLLPAQGDAEIVEVLERYDVRYLLFTMGDAENWGPGPWSVWAPLRDGLRARLGPYRLERVAATETLVVFRLVRER
jgi:hypothetical protein